jgi:hypothetical protein
MRVNRGSIIFHLLFVTGGLVFGHAARAEDPIEIRAARVCAGIGQINSESQGTIKIDNLDLRATTNGTVTIRRDGVDLGKIDKGTYESYTACLIAVMKLLAQPPGPVTNAPVNPRKPPTTSPPPEPPVVTYKTCTGSLESVCPSHDYFFLCGANLAAWARAQCGSFTITKVDSYGGDRCGYSINQIVCRDPR